MVLVLSFILIEPPLPRLEWRDPWSTLTETFVFFHITIDVFLLEQQLLLKVTVKFCVIMVRVLLYLKINICVS